LKKVVCEARTNFEDAVGGGEGGRREEGGAIYLRDE
jgi:hypothetical protein